jgi:cell division protein FtsI/penicillin-binding protein 2
VVAAVRDAHGVLTETKPEIVGTPFSAKTASLLRTMLTSVVDNGFDKARIPRYDVAGKTGTAQIAAPDRAGYLEGQYNHSFVGFAPASDPRFVILIKMERPQGITFAADSLSPSFKDMASFLLNYLHIPPTR